MSKTQLLAHADANGMEGVSASMTKAQIIAAIEAEQGGM